MLAPHGWVSCVCEGLPNSLKVKTDFQLPATHHGPVQFLYGNLSFLVSAKCHKGTWTLAIAVASLPPHSPELTSAFEKVLDIIGTCFWVEILNLDFVVACEV